MFFTERKLESRIQELQEYRYRDKIGFEEFFCEPEEQGVVNPILPQSFEGWSTIAVGDYWKGRDLYLWLHKDVKIPEQWNNKKVVGIFDYGNTGAGNNSGFESLLYVDGKPYQGVDVNHKEVFFKEAHCGNVVSLTFRLWSGLEGGGVPTEQEHKIKRADLAWLDETVDGFYYMSLMVSETLGQLNKHDAIRFSLLEALDEAFMCIDWTEPGSEAFYQSIYKADMVLHQKMDETQKHSKVTVHCVGHTHIDVAWLWRLKHTREKVARSFSTVIRLMEQYPDYTFLQTQPQLYEYIKEDYPEIYEKIKQKIRDGQWEVDGGMWVEADCNLTSGESLTRQILIGSKFIKDEFDKDVEYLWLPDVFGYSWALPQILKKAGIQTFMTTKISWNQYNRMPHDTFWWKGIDGSEILTHFITTVDPWSEEGSWFYTYNGKLTPKTVKGSWEAYSEKEINQDLLISYGYGDGGGGVNRDMLEQRRCLDQIPGLPNVKSSTAGAFFDKLHKNIEETNRFVHTWDGELYLEYHRGTYTSQGYNKRMNRKMEQLYRKAEWYTVMQGIIKNTLAEAQQEKLTMGWKYILTDQFHDIIPGSSIHEVYEDSRKDYDYIEQIATEVATEFIDVVRQEQADTFTVINPSNWKQNLLVCVPESRSGSFCDTNGNILPSQKDNDSTYVYINQMGSMGVQEIRFNPTKLEEVQTPFIQKDRSIETPFYQISLNAYGQIERLYDKIENREVLPKGTRANVLQMFEDKPLGNDAWDIDIFYQEKMQEVTELTKFQVVSCGNLRMVIHMEWKYHKTTITQDMILYANNKRIDFETHVDFHEQHKLLKTAFPVDVRSTYATYDVQYGNVRRPNHWNTSWDLARFESVAHRFVDLSERGYGVSLLNDCKYGHDVKDNVIRLTLLKSATHPDHLQDQGEHMFTYALLPHKGDFVDGETVPEAFALNNPAECVKGSLDLGYENFLSFDNPYIELDAVKKSESGEEIVIRFHDFAGTTQNVTLNLGFTYLDWVEADLRERPLGETGQGEIKLTLHPYEIKTILIKR